MEKDLEEILSKYKNYDKKGYALYYDCDFWNTKMFIAYSTSEKMYNLSNRLNNLAEKYNKKDAQFGVEYIEGFKVLRKNVFSGSDDSTDENSD